MYRLSTKPWRTVGVLIAFLMLSPVATADLLDGELGRWLTDRVAPKLVRHVGQHPRFAGTTLEIVALADQRPTAESNELVGAIADYLQHRLLEQSQARIAWSGTADNCHRLPAAALLLGIEISGSGSRHRVSIRGLDPEEGVWLPGVSFRWQGPLDDAEHRALRRPVALGPEGTRARPFAPEDRAAIADALAQQLACRSGIPLEGRAAFATAETAEDAGQAATHDPRLRRLLASRLQRVPLLSLSRQPDGAEWLLSLEAGAEAPGVEELVLVARADGSQQRLASTFVAVEAKRGASDGVPGSAVTRNGPSRMADRALLPLLSELTRLPGNDCPKTVRPARDEYCVAVDLALEEDGYLFSFRVENGRVIANQCGRSAEHSAPGRRRFRLVLDRESTVTFYALATRDVRTAEALQRFFNDRSSSCDGARRFEAGQWLVRLERIVGNTSAVDWQALELTAIESDLLAVRDGG